MKIQKAMILALLVIVLMSCKGEAPENVEAEPVQTHEDLVSRGEYLVTVIGCADCHTPKKNDRQRTGY